MSKRDVNGVALFLSVVMAALLLPSARADNPAGGLVIDPIVGYNLVVDSNIETPAGRSPTAAYLGVKFCNTNTFAISNVVAYIGDFDAQTPGYYPVTYTNKPGPGDSPFYLTHESGEAEPETDARRVIGTIEPGECRVEYWLVSYPLLDSGGNAVHAPSVKPDDDLILFYDIWAEANVVGTVVTAEVTRTVTCRNEITAMANKIIPNQANKVPQEYLDLLEQYVPEWKDTPVDGTVGTRIVLEGFWYDLGVINQGFDNNGDLVPDYNAWMQPVGDPAGYDASCFRLVKTRAMVVVKLKPSGEKVYIVEDQLYFENVPENSGAIGLVLYEFLPLRPNCYSVLTPYQEVASGFDNEKFNADYGVAMGFMSTTSSVIVDKQGNQTVIPGSNISYSVAFTNTGNHTVGGIVISDSIPDGTYYVSGSATTVQSYVVFYSTNNGATWTEVEPTNASSVTDIQWWLNDELGSNAYGEVGFEVNVPTNYSGSAEICNTACITIEGVYDAVCDEICTEVQGPNALGDTVWRDDGSGGGYSGNQVQEAGEPGISNITVRLYSDVNTNGSLDAADLFIRSTNTGAAGYYMFTNLLDGQYIAAVDWADPDLPYGYTLTTPGTHWADLDSARVNPVAVVYTNADFGFAPALTLDKALLGTNRVYEGRNITFKLTVTNNLQGTGGTAGASRVYNVWANAQDLTSDKASGSGTGNKSWNNVTNAWVPPYPDGIGCIGPFDNAGEMLALMDFRLPPQAGSITSVYIVLPVLQTVGVFGGDTFETALWKNGTLLWSTSVVAGTITTGDLMFNVTSVSNWTWGDFNSTNLTIKCTTQKAGNPTIELYIDTFGFRIWGNGEWEDPLDSTILNPVPLTDRYPTNLLRYVSAVPSPTVATNDASPFGLLWWNNIGPIYPGGASTVLVTFTVLEPPNNQQTTVTNYCWVTNATFVNGVPANMATDEVPVVIYPAGSIGDYVWRDNNGNGLQDDGLSNVVGIANVRVVLYPPTNVDIGAGANIPMTNVTDRNGWYLFTGLPSTGLYTVVVLTNTIPGSFTNTYDEDNGTTAPNSRTVVSNMIPTSTVFSVQNHLTADFGYRLSAALDGTVWHDVNRSGTPPPPDPGEEWITGVVVRLYYSTNLTTALATNRTDINGYFIFTGLQPNNYTVIVSTNEGALANGVWYQSYDTNGTNTPHSATSAVPAGGVGHVDFSYYKGGFEFGDEVFWDWDGDGVRDANEEGIPNISVYAYEDANTNGSVDAGVDASFGVQVTSATGFYLFPNMPPTNIYVYVDELDPDFPDRVVCTADPDGVYDGRNVFRINTSNDYVRDFGYQPYGYGAIGDFVWHDVDGDAVQDAGERGITNITVWLYVDANGDGTYVPLYSNSTDSAGWYIFTNLPDMDYRVVVDANDADMLRDNLGYLARPTTVTNYDITIVNNSTNLTADFGFVRPGVLGDTIFWDIYEDGSQGWNEDGIPGVTVELYRDVNSNGFYEAGTDVYVTNATTDADGVYLFTGLWPTNYIVVVDTTSGPLPTAMLSADPDNDGIPCSNPAATNCDSAYGYSIRYEEVFLGADFGYIPPGVIGDLVWIDQNDNGIRDNGEFGIPYVDVILYSNGVAIATNETDPDGIYGFYGLMDGTFRVVVDTNDVDFPPYVYANWDYDGTLDSETPNILVENGVVTSIAGSGCSSCNTNIDFGYRYAGTNMLSGTVGLDARPFDGLMGTTGSGVSSNEAPFPGVSVYLLLWEDDGDDTVEAGETIPLMSTVTATNGDYAFYMMPTGHLGDRYIVSLAAPYDNLTMTTTNGSTTALWVNNTVDPYGNTISAYQVLTIQPVTTNVDFAFTWRVQYDFGDLPETYSTLLQNLPSGPQNEVLSVTNLYLGAWVDTEDNGQPTVDATGDGPDEDGVDLPYTVWQDGNGGGRVSVAVGLGPGWVTGYIDFDNDGSFMQAGEMVANQAVSTGGYMFVFNVPTGTIQAATTTVLHARFRLFKSEPFIPELAFSAYVASGEVEDYRWELGALGNLVWEDINSNDTYEVYEPVFSNVTVFADLNSNGVWDAGEPTTDTDTNGVYWVGGFPRGDYPIRVDTSTLPTNDYFATYDLDGGTDNVAVVTMGPAEVNPNVDFAYRSPRTTYALVTRFEGSMDGGQAVLEWETAVEQGTLGFNLYRREKNSAEEVRVNERLLPAMIDQPQGGVYRMVDPTAQPGKTYVYQLHEIEFGGRLNFCGVYEVDFAAAARAPAGAKKGRVEDPFVRTPRVSEFTQRRRAESKAAVGAVAKKAPAGSAKALAPGEPWPMIKVFVTNDGAFFVGAAELAGLIGVTPEEVAARVDNAEMQVENRTVSCRYLPVSGGFYFYGVPPDSLYTDTNVYWLSWGGGEVMRKQLDTNPDPVSGGTFRDTIHVEQDFFPVTAPATDPEADYWYWNYLIAGYAPLATKAYEIHAPAVAAGDGEATLVARLFGGSTVNAEDEHHVQVSVNGTVIGEARWDGITALDMTNTFAQSLLVEGSNSVSVTALLATGLPYSLVYVDSFDLTYSRRYEALNDELLVRGDGNPVVTVSGFSSSNICVFDVTYPRRPVQLRKITVDPDGGTWRATFSVANGTTPYHVFVADGGFAPAGLVADAPSDLRDVANEAEHVIITVPLLSEGAQALADHRAAKGLKSRVVLLEDIYDEFSGGVAEPVGIRRFLRYAVNQWSVGPRYAVLAGEGNYDYRNLRGTGDNLVPAVLDSTPQGLQASDGWYADVEGDGTPDLAIGRLPALHAAEMNALAGKIIAYESGEGGRWKQQILLAADNPDDGGDFNKASGQIQALLPRDYEVGTVYLSEQGFTKARAMLREGINSGAAILNYFGHGGLDAMANEKLFQSSDVASMTNGARQPLVISLSCSVGQFALPGFDCLSEMLLLAPGGAVAVWSPSGQSYNWSALQLGDVFFREVFFGGKAVVGDAMLAALQTCDDPRRDTLRKVYNLLGDPATKLEGVAASRPASTMQAWSDDMFTDDQLGDPGCGAWYSDPDGDGLLNLMEYAMGWNPHVADGHADIDIRGPWAVRGDMSGAAVIRYQRRISAQDLDFQLQASRDMHTWAPADAYVTGTTVTDDGNGVTETVEVAVQLPPEDVLGYVFIRLRVRSF